jgi:hypothetical protein
MREASSGFGRRAAKGLMIAIKRGKIRMGDGRWKIEDETPDKVLDKGLRQRFRTESPRKMRENVLATGVYTGTFSGS